MECSWVVTRVMELSFQHQLVPQPIRYLVVARLFGQVFKPFY
jgi:hypothetical protein